LFNIIVHDRYECQEPELAGIAFYRFPPASHVLERWSEMKQRGSGILLHISSLPSPYGIGDIGPAAWRFADFLRSTGQKYWQILPLTITDPAHDNNPYHSISAFAHNPLFISPELMAADGLIDASDITNPPDFPGSRVDFSTVIPYKEMLFGRAWERFSRGGGTPAYDHFCTENAGWLDDFALFSAIRSDRPGLAWNQWPDELKNRNPAALATERERLHEAFERTRFLQFVFISQWERLRARCRDAGITLVGDIPIYVDHDSADVWQYPDYFKLDSEGNPTVVAGVPPDYFSATGQLWNTPVYQWDALKSDHFSWWVRRLGHSLSLVDIVRIDHFRGLVACWEVPAGSLSAAGGRWVSVPANDLLIAFARAFPRLPVFAEDLGIITPDVHEVMQKFGIRGMKVLLFAFEDGFPDTPYLPHNVIPACYLYTGTHDNAPVRGWIEEEATATHRARMRQYFGRDILPDEASQVFIRLAMSTVADTVIIPLQDLLGLGQESRMNRPGTCRGNWKWRFSEAALTPEIRTALRSMTAAYARD